MAKVKDGFYKQVDHKQGDDNYVLLAGGGHKDLSTVYTKKIQAIPFIVGDTGTAAGTWTGSCDDIDNYYDGLSVIFVPSVEGASTTTLNINSKGAITCYYNASTKLTTHYPVGTPILLTYYNNTWRTAEYDTNSNYLVAEYYARYKVNANGYIGRYMLVMKCPDGTITGLCKTNNSTATNKTMYTGPLLLDKIFYMASSTGSWAANDNMSTNLVLYENYSLVDVRYTFNCGSTLSTNSPFYIVLNKGTDGYYYLDTTQPWQIGVPTTNSDKIYYHIGSCYDTYRIAFECDKKTYQVKNGKLVEYKQYAEDANNSDLLDNYHASMWFKIGSAYPQGKSDKPWHLVAEFTQSNASENINTGITLFVRKFTSANSTTKMQGILVIRCRYESGEATPSFYNVVWLVNNSLPVADFVVTYKRDNNIVTLRLYCRITGWVAYYFNKIDEGGWNSGIDSWTLYHALNNNAYAMENIPTDETQIASELVDISNNAASATKLKTARTINGTSFDGTANITTSKWGTARTLTIGDTGKSVDGSGNVSWSLAEIGAATSEHTHEFNDISNKLIGSSLNEFDFADNYNTTSIWINWKLSKNNTTNTTYIYSQAKNTNDVRVGIDQYIFGRGCGSELEHNYSYIYANGYRSAIHNSDNYILLAGGGVKAVSDFSTTDNKVTQNKSTSSENLRVLFKYSANDTNETNYSKYSSTLYYNPSTKLLTNSGGLTINEGVVNITGITSYAEGIRLHNVSGLSSIWFGAVNSTGYDNGMWGISVDTNGMRFRGPKSSSGTSPNDYINILHGGNVGIGNTSPSYKLDVAGTGQFTSTSNTVLRLISSNTDSSILYSQSSGISWTVGSTSSNKFYFANNYDNSNSYSIVSYINNLGSGNFKGIGMDNYIAYPKDAMYLNITSSITGAIQISLPTAVWKSNTMMKMTVEIFNYSTGTSSTYIISGYNYTTPSWANVTAYSLRNGLQDKGNLKVRFGWNSATTRNIIWIGETNTVWSYPKVYVKDICLGQSNDSFDKWISGWDISFVQDFEVVYTTISNPAINYNSNLLDSHQRIGNLDIINNNYLVKQAFFDVSANSQSPEIDKYYRIATFIAGTGGYDRDALLYTIDIVNKKYWLYRVVHRRNTSTDKNYQIYVISTNSSPDYLRIYYGEYNQSAEIFITQKTSETSIKTILTKVFIEGLRASLEGNYIQLDSTVVETSTYTNYNSGQYAINISWSSITDKPTYWANLSISTTSDTETTPQFKKASFGYDYTSVAYGINIGKDATDASGTSNGIFLYTGNGTTARIYRYNDILYITRAGNATAGIAINASGYVGIGTGATSPSYKLHVTGSGYFTGTVISTASPGFANDVSASSWAYSRFKSGTTSEWHVGTTSGTVGILGQANAFEIRDTKSSYTGIAIRCNTSSNGKLVVTSASGETSIGLWSKVSGVTKPQWVFGLINTTNNRYGFYSGVNSKWIANFSQNGNLYLGDDDTEGLERLDVNGNSRIRGNNEYLGTGTGAQCHLQYNTTNKCLDFIFD